MGFNEAMTRVNRLLAHELIEEGIVMEIVHDESGAVISIVFFQEDEDVEEKGADYIT